MRLMRYLQQNRWSLLVAVIVMIGALAAAGWAAKREPAPASNKPAASEAVLELAESDIAFAHEGSIARVLRANGTLRAHAQAIVRAKVTGEIVELTLREGDRVGIGQVLAKIESDDYKARFAERTAALEAAKSQAALAEATRVKNEELLRKGFISSLAYDNVKGAAQVAAEQVRQQQAQLDMAKKALADTVVRSPIAGWVAERAMQRGDKTNIDGKLFTLVDLTRMELEALVPAGEIAQLVVGQRFIASVAGFGERKFAGRVARIGAATQSGNRYLPIYIEFDNLDAALKVGLFAEGGVQLSKAQGKALIPVTALRSEAGANFVYVIENDRLARKPVQIGLVSEAEGLVDVVQGLAAGTRVVAMNLGTLKEGARVQIAAKK